MVNLIMPSREDTLKMFRKWWDSTLKMFRKWWDSYSTKRKERKQNVSHSPSSSTWYSQVTFFSRFTFFIAVFFSLCWSSLYYTCAPGHHSLDSPICVSLNNSLKNIGEFFFGRNETGFCSSSSMGCSKFISATTVPLIGLGLGSFAVVYLNIRNNWNQSRHLSRIYQGKWKWLNKARDVCIILFSGDTKMYLLTTIFIVIPLLFYSIIHPIYIHWNDPTECTTKYKIIFGALANPTGKGAIMALSFFLVPVSRQSPILVACGINPIQALLMHIIAGRICLILTLAHAFIYTADYVIFGWVDGKNMWKSIATAYFPAKSCWKWSNLAPMAFRKTDDFKETKGENKKNDQQSESYDKNEGYGNSTESNHTNLSVGYEEGGVYGGKTGNNEKNSGNGHGYEHGQGSDNGYNNNDKGGSNSHNGVGGATSHNDSTRLLSSNIPFASINNSNVGIVFDNQFSVDVIECTDGVGFVQKNGKTYQCKKKKYKRKFCEKSFFKSVCRESCEICVVNLESGNGPSNQTEDKWLGYENGTTSNVNMTHIFQNQTYSNETQNVDETQKAAMQNDGCETESRGSHHHHEVCGYGYWRNFTGVVSCLALILLCITSLSKIRRWSYRLFYATHVVLGWTMLIFALLHWGPAGLYMMPSIIYYLACTMPVVIQSFANFFIDGGVKLSKTTFIRNSNKCVEIIFPKSHAAHLMETAYSGPYVRICVPELSLMWHPFTVASSLDDPSKLKLLFRVYGPFTNKLYNRLEKCENAEDEKLRLPPTILIDGYYGSQDWASQAMKHDSVLMVAGGIGITPFLSMIATLHAAISNCSQTFDKNKHKVTTKYVAFHWFCRDEGLIRHVLQHHLRFMIKKDCDDVIDISLQGCVFDINIHYTAKEVGDKTPFNTNEIFSDVETNTSEKGEQYEGKNKVIIHQTNKGCDMEGSRFSIDRQFRYLGNLPSLIVFAAIAVPGVMMLWDQNANYIALYHSAVNLRGYQLYIILAISILVALLSNFAWYAPGLYKRMTKRIKMRKSNQGIFVSKYSLEPGLVNPDELFLSTSDNVSGSGNTDSDNGSGSGSSGADNDDTFADEDLDHLNRSRTKTRSQLIEHVANDKLNLSTNSSQICDTVDDNDHLILPHQSHINGVSILSIQIQNGRPIIDDIIKPVTAGAAKPGTFMCGPSKLLRTVKKSIKKQTRKCSFYEEEFEM